MSHDEAAGRATLKRVVGELALWVCVGIGLAGCQSLPPVQPQASTALETARRSYSTPFRLHLALYANTRFHWRPSLDSWGRSLDALQVLAETEWGIPRTRIHRLQDQSAQGFLNWLESLQSAVSQDETLLLYFATHQLADGTLCFTTGPPLSGLDLVGAVNRLANHARIILINDSCFAEGLESCGGFLPQVVRLHACGRKESAVEVKFKQGSPQSLGFFASECRWLETGLQAPVEGMSLLGVLWTRAVRELMAEGGPAISWRQIAARLQTLRDTYAVTVFKPRAQHPKHCPPEADFVFLREHPVPLVSLKTGFPGDG
jgi:hypothetical protein